MTLRSSLALLALSALLTGCPDNGDDTDTDTGVDTDPGTEAQKNTTLPDGTTGFSGTMTYDSITTGFDEVEADINRSCSAEFAISGDEFAGACNDCDWAFTLSTTENANDCGDDLDRARALQIPQTTAGDGTNVLAFWEYLDGGQATYSDVLAVVTPTEDGLGFGDAIGLYYYGDAYGAGGFNIDGSSFTWTIDGAERTVFRSPTNGSACADEGISVPVENLESVGTTGETASGTVACPEEGDDAAFDEYILTLSAGDVVSVSVDTVGADTAFDPAMLILGPSGCSVGFVDDSFDCTFEPTDYQCPGATFTAAEDGDHRLMVFSYGSCVDDTQPSAYEVRATVGTLETGGVALPSGDATVEVTSTIDIAVDATFE